MTSKLSEAYATAYEAVREQLPLPWWAVSPSTARWLVGHMRTDLPVVASIVMFAAICIFILSILIWSGLLISIAISMLIISMLIYVIAPFMHVLAKWYVILATNALQQRSNRNSR